MKRIMDNLPDYETVNWRDYSDTKNGFLLLCGLKRELGTAGSVEVAAAHMGVNPGLISRVLKGGDSPTLRRYFGIPDKQWARVSPCADCGKVHNPDFCTKADGNYRVEWMEERDELRDEIESLMVENIALRSKPPERWYMNEGESFGRKDQHEEGQPEKPPPPNPKKAKRKRTRIAADVSPEQREALHNYAARHRQTWTEYCRALADNLMATEKAEEAEVRTWANID
jgi:hypothetical protein